MPVLIGTDEAGYGPNLGPLVISATVWRVPDKLHTTDLYELLKRVVTRTPHIGRGGGPSVVLADSKAIYKAGGSLAGLECGIFSALALLGQRPTRWRDVWQALAADSAWQLATEPWSVDFDRPVPLDVDADHISLVSQAWQQCLQQTGVEFCGLRSVAVFPDQFNRCIDQLGNKASLLSKLTLELVAREIQTAADEPILVQCDKHGGRNKYGPHLQQAFPDYLVEVYEETRARSVYRWGTPPRRVEIRFSVHGEQFLPCALASMASKYLRELAMLAFNDFWGRHVPGLKPTAGYPEDARRFKAEIAACQTRLQIPDHSLWRNR